jgi:hypothetical protein
MKRVLVLRSLTLEIAPMFTAAIACLYMPRLAALAFILAGLLILISAGLCIRDGVVFMSHTGILDYRRKDPFMFWSGISVHFCLAAFCFFAAGIIIFRRI